MRAFLFALLLLLAPSALAQNPPTKLSTQPNASSTIIGTNSFQPVFAQNGGRGGCTIQNNGSATMYVFFGPLANATLTNSIQVPATFSLYCNLGPVVLGDQVSITGTATQAYYAEQW